MTRGIYSFIIDSDERFIPQTRTFLATLIGTGISPGDIIAQITPSAGSVVRTLPGSFGVQMRDLEPCLDGRYCNKIAQLSTLKELECDYVVLCDTDIAFRRNLSGIVREPTVFAKPVDFPNPPLERLDALRVAAGITAAPVLTRTSCTAELTYRTNCNGGIYVLPFELLADFQPLWVRFARLALERSDILEHWTHHADQIGFALAMLELGLSFNELPVEYNFPTHAHHSFPNMAFDRPSILHYHDCHDAEGRIHQTGHPLIDQVIDQINATVGILISTHGNCAATHGGAYTEKQPSCPHGTSRDSERLNLLPIQQGGSGAKTSGGVASSRRIAEACRRIRHSFWPKQP
jgi:hypothetical protein